MPATELVVKVPPPKVGRSSRRISGRVSVPDAVVGGLVVVGAAVVAVVGGRVVGAAVVVVAGGAVVAGWLVVGADAVEPVLAVDGATVDAVLTAWSEVEEVVVSSPSTVTTRAPAGWVDRAAFSGAAATTLDVVGKVSTAAESGWVQEVMASPIASTASGGLERIRSL